MQRAPAYNPLQGHTGVVTSLVVAIDDAGVTTIMSGSRDKSVRLWDGVTGNVKSVIQGHASALTSVGFCNTLNGCTIVTGSHDNSVRLWDAVTGSQQKSLLDASAAADVEVIHLRKQRLGRLLLAAYLILVILLVALGVLMLLLLFRRERKFNQENLLVYLVHNWCRYGNKRKI